MKTISVIVPAYNSERFLADCLSSILAQTRKPHEIIVVNDASTDRTAEIAQDSGVTLINRDRNGGPAAARALGAKKATGEILAFLDSDCIAPPDWLESIAAEMEKDPELGGIGGPYRHSRPVSGVALVAKWEEEYAHALFSLDATQSNPPGGNSAFLKKVWDETRSGREIHLFRDVRSGEDDFVCNEIRSLAKVRFIPSLAVQHSPRGARDYILRHINRGRSAALQWLRGLKAQRSRGTEAYGGYGLLFGSVALALALCSLSLFFVNGPLATASFFSLLGLHVVLTRKFFAFVGHDETVTALQKVKISLWMFVRSCCWMFGALQLLAQGALLRLQTAWNVVLSIAHFWMPGRISKLFYFVTSACNARCDFCFNLDNVIHWKERQPTELSLDEVRAIAANFKRLPYLNLSGGEPFMRRNLPEIIEAFHRLCKTQWVTIPTNASLTRVTLESTQEILTRCPGLFLTVQVSIDSMYEDHDRSRKVKGGFAALTKTLYGLGRLRALYPRLRVQVATCYDDFNVSRMQEMIDFCRTNFSYDQQMFYLIRETGQQVTSSKNHLLPSFLSTLEENENYEWARYGRSLWSRAVRVLQGMVYVDFAEIRTKGKFIRVCHATRKFATLYDDGQVSPCEILDSVSLGSIRDYGYDFYRLMHSRETSSFYKTEIVEKKCNCDWTCAIPINMLYDFRVLPRLARSWFRPAAIVKSS